MTTETELQSDTTDPTTAQPEGLTAQHLKALRSADRLLLCHAGGGGRIDAVREYGHETVHCDIPVSSTINRMGEYVHDSAHESVHLWGGSPEATAISLLRKGDVLELLWKPDAMTNDLLRHANLHGDRVELHVHRGKRTLVFALVSHVAADNTARMFYPW